MATFFIMRCPRLSRGAGEEAELYKPRAIDYSFDIPLPPRLENPEPKKGMSHAASGQKQDQGD